MLQFCSLGPQEIPAIAEMNPDKFGHVTPGTHIPIVPEADARKMKPDYFLVLPWHFKEGILHREREYLADGGRMIFSIPGNRNNLMHERVLSIPLRLVSFETYLGNTPAPSEIAK